MKERLDKFLVAAYQFVVDNHHEWKLTNDVNLEVVDHVLRVRVQDKTIKNHMQDVFDLCKYQNPDGGFGNSRDDQDSKSRSTALSVQMLIRSNRVLKSPTILKSINKGLDYIVKNQHQDGNWNDSTWHHYDATSVSVGTLLFATKEDSWSLSSYTKALARGIAYIDSQRDKDYMWYFKKSGSPVTITAHLLPKVVTYRGVEEKDFNTTRKLIALQHDKGHWDNTNVDHTCDAIRAMMLVAGKANDKLLYKEVHNATTRALNWLLTVSKDIGGGLGDFPLKKAHVEATCDGIDTVLKFNEFNTTPDNMINFWS
jgi:hypothetical protein